MSRSRRSAWQIGIVCLLTGGTSISANHDQSAAVEIGSHSQAREGRPPTGDRNITSELNAESRDPGYRIRPGDSLELTFTLTPEFSQTVTVRPDGYITLRGREDLQVEGLTTPQLRQKLQEAYAGILREPVMTVDLKDFERPYFVALGEVMKPGKYDLRGDTTVTDALAIAGGFNEGAKHSQVLLVREVSAERFEIKQLNVKQMLSGEGMREDLRVQPGDMLFVPKNVLSKIKQFIPRAGLGVSIF